MSVQISAATEVVGGATDQSQSKNEDYHQAKEIEFFGNQMDKSITQPNAELEAFTLDDRNIFDEDDDEMREESHTDQEQEERADAEFVSEIEGSDEKCDGEDSESKKNDDEEASQQYSIDDVTDDEEGDGEEPAAIDEDDNEEQEENRGVSDTEEKNIDNTAIRIKQQQASTAYDSQATNQCSSSSDGASKKASVAAVVASESQAIEETAQISVQTMNVAPSRSSLKKEPQLDRENVVSGHIKKFLAHIETREINSHQGRDPGDAGLRKSTRRKKTDEQLDDEEARSSSNSSSKSSDSEPNKDNEDPNAVVLEKADAFDPKELKYQFDGWSFYKKTRISFAPVRRYQYMIDQDYKKNKVTVCAHLQNIYNSFSARRGKAQPTVSNYFDIEKWLTRMGQIKKDVKDTGSPSKELRRINTLAVPLNHPDEMPDRKDNLLLSKSNSTTNIPESSRGKNVRRMYANFDKDLAVKMFGYRVLFSKKKMLIEVPDPKVSQGHKPLQRFVHDIIGELNQMYQPIHRYHTKQRVLIPVPDSDEEEFFNNHGLNTPPEVPTGQTLAHGNRQKSQSYDSQVSPEGAQDADTKKKCNGELVVLKTRTGDKQTFLKKTRNLQWHCNPPERQQSATSNQKRNQNVKNTSGYGAQSFNQGSPARNGSPKKLPGQQNPSKFGQTNFLLLKSMNMVRYALPRAGVMHVPGQNPSASLRYGQSGPGNQNFNNYRRQNSYRKSQQRMRGDSAKGSRGIRQSMENQQNPGLRLINQHPSQRSSSDQTFISHNQVTGHNDNEVAQITSQQTKQQSSNVVYLKDPKHIQGFGSNVVHVNVSCGQSVPENQQAGATPATNTGNAAKQGKGPTVGRPQSTTAQAPAVVEKEEDEDAQTFIIQLTEDQTRQLSSGSLKLNGVPIPKDLSNLTYEQIMALLDSVNFKGQQTKTNAKKTPVQSKSTLLGSRDHGQQLRNTETTQRRAQGAQKASHTIHQGSTYSSHEAAGAKKYNSSFTSSKAHPFMGTMNLSDAKQLTQNHANNLNLYSQQSTYHMQNNSNLMMHMDKQGLRTTQKPGRQGISGRESGQQQYTSAPQKVQRVDSATRRRGNRVQQQPMSFSSSTKNEDMQQRQQRMRVQKGRSLAPGTQATSVVQQQMSMTRNSDQHNASTAGQNSIPNKIPSNAGVPVNPAIMGNQESIIREWDMLSLLQQQQQQLKNAQQFLQHSNINLEHKRKLQDQSLGPQASDRTNPGQDVRVTRPAPAGGNHQMSKSQTGQEGFNRGRGVGQGNHYNYVMPKNGQSLVQEINKPVAGTSLVRNSVGGAPQGVSQQMMVQQQNQQFTKGQQGFNNVRTVPSIQQPVQQKNSCTGSNNTNQQPAPQQQRSMTRLNSKKRLNQNRKTTSNVNSSEQTQSSQRANHNSAPTNHKTNHDSIGGGSSQQSNLLCPPGKVNSNLIAHENKLISNHQSQTTTGSQHNLISGKTDPNKALSTKNQLVKNSIELEYSKFESNSTILNVSGTGANKMNTGAKKSSVQHFIQHERGGGATSQYYHARANEEVSGTMPAQKLRINQQALNNNLNYANQSTTHKRKIESALAQSAINAIQGQNGSGGGGNQHGSSLQPVIGSPFFHLEQKSKSQPYNEMPNQNYHQGGVNSIRKPQNQGGGVGQPQFIMRNGHQAINSSTEPIKVGGTGMIKGGGYPFMENQMRGPTQQQQQQHQKQAAKANLIKNGGGQVKASGGGASRSIHLSRE